MRSSAGNRLIRYPIFALIMARSDSVLFFLAGFTHLLIFVARHHKEFTESYNKLEKATMARGDSGRLQRVDPLPVKRRMTNVVIPGILAFIAAMAWLAN